MILAIAALLAAPAVPQHVVAPLNATVSEVSSPAPAFVPQPAPAPALFPPAASLETSPSVAAAFSIRDVNPSSLDVVVPEDLGQASHGKAAHFVSPAFGTTDRPKTHTKLWLALFAAQGGAATFDAWSTRNAVSAGAREVDPMIRPFASNDSVYAAVQVTPVILAYVSYRMMNSHHAWMRHIWWAPQVAGAAASLFSGFNNVAVASSLR